MYNALAASLNSSRSPRAAWHAPEALNLKTLILHRGCL
jgi:hypothetical protein